MAHDLFVVFGDLSSTFLLGNDKLTIKGSRDTGCFFWPRGVFDRGIKFDFFTGCR